MNKEKGISDLSDFNDAGSYGEYEIQGIRL
jgi:hypothetical protein